MFIPSIHALCMNQNLYTGRRAPSVFWPKVRDLMRARLYAGETGSKGPGSPSFVKRGLCQPNLGKGSNLEERDWEDLHLRKGLQSLRM